MKKLITLILAIALIFSVTACTEKANNQEETGKIKIAVSLVPEMTFVKKVAGDNVDIVTVIPPGYSPANYQPTTQQMQELSDVEIYFVMQMPAEESNILPKIYDFNPDIKLVNLREAVREEHELLYAEEHSHGDEDTEDEHDEDHENEHELSVDPHIWLSPKRVMTMVQTIADELSAIDEENAETYQKNAAEYIEELNDLDDEIREIVDGMQTKAFMIYHGAYGYFADDYGLEMVSIEEDGKSATAVKMQEVIDFAKEHEITAIFYQDEFDDTQAQTVAEEIGGKVKVATPLSENYIQGLLDFANALANDE